MDKKIVITTAILGALTIGIGAFGAHGLKQLVSEEALATFETGVRYQLFHVVALLVLGMTTGISQATKKWVFRFFVLGMLLFSGSIYALSLAEVLPFSVKFLGPVTPIGGLLFMLGWLRIGYGVLKLK
ncbi:MAG: DUF423 domain-containing protein [Bacteroidetes bacterium]|nr:DUF423 domain-containing protein [Bacteroidota bacterium]